MSDQISPQVLPQVDGIDFAVAAYRDDGAWQVDEITDRFLLDVDALAAGLRRFAADSGALGLVAVDEDFFVIVRVAGTSVRMLLSDVTAADEWELAQSVVDVLGLPVLDEDDDPVPAGDLGLLADLGVSAVDLAALLDDDEAYPDEVLSEIAARLGFGALFDEAAGLTPA